VLATTGLRNKELRLLELQDIRWRTAEVLVRRTKTKRDRVAPLLQEVGESARRLCATCQTKDQQSADFPILCSANRSVQIQHADIEDCAISVRTKWDRTSSRRWCPSCAPQPGNAPRPPTMFNQ
jgi:integrase